MPKAFKFAVPCVAALVMGVVSAAFEPAGGFRSSAARAAAKRLLVPTLRMAATGPEAQGAGRVTQEEESAPSLDEDTFLDTMSRDLRDVKDLADKYDALDEPAASPQTLFAKLDEAAARMPHTSRDIYESAAASCREIARKSIEETALAAKREAAEEKKPVEPRHFGGNALNGFAFLSLAASAAALVAANPTFGVSQISPPIVDFSSMPAMDLSRADFAFPSFDLPSVDVGALLGVEQLAEGTKQALTAVISTVGATADAAHAEVVKMQSHATDLFATASDHAEAIAAQVADIRSAAPSQLVAAQEAATRTATDLTVSLQREAAAFQSKAFADIADFKVEAVAFQSRAIDAAGAGIQSAVEGTKDLLLTQIDAARAGAQGIQDSLARRAQDFTPSSPSLSLRVEPPDWRSILASANEAEDAMITSFNQQLEAAKSSVTEAAQIIAWAEDEGRGALMAHASAARDAAAVELTKSKVQPPGMIAPSLPVALPDWIDESTVGLAKTVIGLY